MVEVRALWSKHELVKTQRRPKGAWRCGDFAVLPLVTLGATHRTALNREVKPLGSILSAQPRLTIGPVSGGGRA
jgi:hypothetical protein